MSESLIFVHIFFGGVGWGWPTPQPLELFPSSPVSLGLSIIKAHTSKDLTHVSCGILPALKGGPKAPGPGVKWWNKLRGPGGKEMENLSKPSPWCFAVLFEFVCYI